MSPGRNCSRRCAFWATNASGRTVPTSAWTTQLDGEFHVTVPEHYPIKIGTFKSILKLVAAHHGLTVDELLEKLDL